MRAGGILIDDILVCDVPEGVVIEIEILGLLGLDWGQRGSDQWNGAGCSIPAPLTCDGTGPLLPGAFLTRRRRHIGVLTLTMRSQDDGQETRLRGPGGHETECCGCTDETADVSAQSVKLMMARRSVDGLEAELLVA